LSTRFVRLQSLRAGWNELLARCWSQSVFLTWEWIEAWCQTYQAGFDLLILVARQDSEICGIAPLVSRRDTLRLEFVGQNKAYGEYLDFLVPRGLESSIIPALCKSIMELGGCR
jgi:CelD/BcsL family acetyltransferase involved in cellulose biosynthesis